jgi:hypothetical protein
MDAVLLQQQIQVGVGETTGTPMLLGDDVARLRLELGEMKSLYGSMTASPVRSFAYINLVVFA